MIRRGRIKYRLIIWGVLVLLYSVYSATLAPAEDNEAPPPGSEKPPAPAPKSTLATHFFNQRKQMRSSTPTTTTEEISPVDPDNYEQEEEEEEKTRKTGAIYPSTESETEKAKSKADGSSTKAYEEIRQTTEDLEEAVPTWRPKRVNCTPPAIEQFPPPMMSQSARKNGGLIFHIIICLYSFIALAIVCDDYFVTSLDRICEELKLRPDVAGATFMAAGSSAPELATVIIGVFFAKDDIGISGVIGSAVFNIMFVIAVCGLFSGSVSYLNWYPLCRDCAFYALSILVMLIAIYNEKVNWFESVLMLLTYVLYCVILYHNKLVEAWVYSLPIPCVNIVPHMPEELYAQQAVPEEDSGLMNDPNKQNLGYAATENIELDGAVGNSKPATNLQVPQGPVGAIQDYYVPREPHGLTTNPLERPDPATVFTLTQWYVTYPIHYMCRSTMPDVKTEKFRDWYPFTFCISMLWISIYSYIMVWMITIVGSTLGIPDTVMGLTFVAAGVSVPDALSSLAVVKEGYGDMAVSNAVGSNVFDILVCLGLPWFLQTAIIKPGSHVNVYSKGLTYSTLSLFSTVIFLIAATHMNGWKLDRKYGAILMVWYFVFLIFGSLYELNVFGYMNPPECPSLY
uniref:Probable sodium/potassium/calcium exchanger CG1090 n=1 Tax=Cacopsylla melanoneura TaxID=428564 RepID=A0A8D9F2W9_9HEMI